MSGQNKQVPKLRFPGFTEDWEQRKLGECFDERSEKNGTEVNELLSVTIAEGVIRQSDSEKRNVVSSDVSNYKKVHEGDIAYNSMRMWQGAEGVSSYNGIVSPAYTVIVPQNGNDSSFFAIMFKRSSMLKTFERNSQGLTSDTWNLKYPALSNITVLAPKAEEQVTISQFFQKLDELITLHQRKLDEIKQFKSGMLQKLFPRDGEKVPEVRFPEFTDDWEQRKFSELVIIERGGSPRPIENYITEEENGLNWVKIGDAPEMGNYITKTAQKIRPEGLKKTREVHPGDLILSNSMSFGKPYIMAIDGCIHDGWLLIRNEQKIFDLKFLCILLGTDSMLNQYKAMAAGSTVNNLNKDLVGNTNISYPSIDEQRIIGDFITKLDETITLHQRKLDALKELKKGLLQQMFV